LPNYSAEFKAKYFKAQADRMNRLIDIALKRQKELNGDDDVFVIRRAEGARFDGTGSERPPRNGKA
jgi:hypothetical protein